MHMSTAGWFIAFLMSTVMSPNIARPLTLRTSPSDYATFNPITSFLYLVSGCFWKKENSKMFSLEAFTAEQGWISAKICKSC